LEIIPIKLLNLVVDPNLLGYACRRFILLYPHSENFHVLYDSLEDIQKLALEQQIIDPFLTGEFSENQIEYTEEYVDITIAFVLPQKHTSLVEKVS